MVWCGCVGWRVVIAIGTLYYLVVCVPGGGGGEGAASWQALSVASLLKGISAEFQVIVAFRKTYRLICCPTIRSIANLPS